MISAALRRVSQSQPLRFLITGGWNTAFAYISVALLYYLLSPRMHYMLILVIGTVINITNGFLCHKFFVFRTKGNYLKEYLRYYVVYSVPIALGFIAFPVCIEVFRMNFYVTQAVLTVVTVFISYFGHKHISFKKSDSSR